MGQRYTPALIGTCLHRGWVGFRWKPILVIVETIMVTDISLLVLSRTRLVRMKLAQGLNADQLLFYEAETMLDAIEMYKRFHPSALLLDVDSLPESDHQLFEKLRLENPLMTVILLGTPDEREEVLRRFGADHFLEKPFLPELIANQIREMTGHEESMSLSTSALRKRRQLQRVEVSGVRLRLYAPIYEKTEIIDIAHSGLKAVTHKEVDLLPGVGVKMEIISTFGNLNLAAKVAWCRDGEVGLLFSNPKPKGFESLLSQLIGVSA